MRYDGRIVFRHLDGSVELYGPGSPVRGVYYDPEYGTKKSVAEMGDGITLSSAQWIEYADKLVAEGALTFTPSETETEYWQRIHDRTKAAVPHLADADWVATIPSAEHTNKDRYFRGAWTWVTPEPVIDVDIARAREIHRDKLRELRAPKLADMDVAYQRADEDGDAAAKAGVIAKKKALRDAPSDPRIVAAATPEELKAVIPDALK